MHLNASLPFFRGLLAACTLIAHVSCSLNEPTGRADVDPCDIEREGRLEVVRPGPSEPPIDDVNWFARPVWNDNGDWLIGFASHDQNYLYNLTTGARIKIPDRSDAVATPDGRFMTVPSYYTPDETIRFYDMAPLLAHLERGQDASQVEPVYVHDHPDLTQVYYQSTAVVGNRSDGQTETTTYRLMFSGTRSESGFRIVDYDFSRNRTNQQLSVRASRPMKLCPEISNDMNTPFISKDGRYVVSYSSSSEQPEYAPGASLRIYRILETLPEQETTRCQQVVDFGFAAGKADFSFDGSKLTFHISKGAYLTPFVNGGLVSPTITDVVVVDLIRDQAGDITGYSGMARLTTSRTEGVGSYFPAFLPDGKLFYIFNEQPKDSSEEKRFSFKVVDPEAESMMANVFADEAHRSGAARIARAWEQSCKPGGALKPHEAPWLLTSLSFEQCSALIEGLSDREELMSVCNLRQD